MAIIYYPNNAFVYSREVSGSNLIEVAISVPPNNSIFLFTGSINLQTSSFTFGSSSYALSASYVPGVSNISSSYSLTSLSSSYAPGSPSVSSSYALSASYVPGVSNISSSYSLTSSYFNEASASLITGSLYLRSNSGSLWKITVFEDADHVGTLQLEGPF